ncbi:MAG TPA: ABC transporter permease [Candidatus Bathyarchaeia archaeon]|jgi:predicted permease|nr:ABC transporter permease [Candidatus Bathyarchaeia archaeon]
MRLRYKLPLRLRSLFHRNKAELDLRDELEFHLQHQIAEYVAGGMDPQEARHAALRSLGGVEQVKEECREARKTNLIEDFARDVRFGMRMLRHSPGFTALAVLCLTLGIGANASVYSWVEGILLRPYPLVSNQERLVALSGTVRDQRDETSWPDLLDVQRSCTLCEELFVSKITGATVSIGERAQVITGSIVSANYFDAIGVHPILGRGFAPGEDTSRNAHPVVVISYHLWKTRFQGDPQILGKTQHFDNLVYIIIGVAPEGFYGTFVGRAMEFWVPASMVEAFEGGGDKLQDRGARWCEAYLRLKPGVTRNQAQQEISAIAARLEAEYPATNRGRGIKVWPLWQTPFNHASHLLPTFEIMVVVVIFVLLIVCANVGNLLLVRSFARRHEMTVRLAIGAGRGRLVRQLVTEGLLLSFCGAAGGMLLAYWCRHALPLFFPGSMYLPGQIDGRVLWLSAAICVVVTLAIGLVPAFQTRHLALADTLKTDASSVMGARGQAWFRSSLVVLQITLSFILLVGATLLMQSLRNIRTTSPGFSTKRVLDTWIPFIAAGYDVPRAKAFQDELIQRVRALPGVEAAAYARIVPLGYIPFSSAPVAVDGYEPQPSEQPTADYNEVSPDYFATLGIPFVSGREFTRNDNETAPRVVIVNQTMVARYWRGQDPVGQRLQVKGDWARVVGIVKDSKYYSMDETPRPFFYVPLRQYFDVEPYIHIRTTQPVQTVQSALLREVRALDPNLNVFEMITLQEQVNRSTSHQLVAVALVALFGGLALLLAGIGLYGVMSYAVSQSTRELGLRMALGAGTSNVLRLVLSRGLLLTTIGITIGISLTLLLTRLLGNLLYQVSPRDPLAFAAAFAVMTVASLAACFLPAWRATRTDPMRALRAE